MPSKKDSGGGSDFGGGGASYLAAAAVGETNKDGLLDQTGNDNNYDSPEKSQIIGGGRGRNNNDAFFSPESTIAGYADDDDNDGDGDDDGTNTNGNNDGHGHGISYVIPLKDTNGAAIQDGNNDELDAQQQPSLSTVLPQLSAQHKAKKMLSMSRSGRRRRDRSSLDGGSATSGGGVGFSGTTSLAYSASSGGTGLSEGGGTGESSSGQGAVYDGPPDGNRKNNGGGRKQHERDSTNATTASSQGGIFSIVSDSTGSTASILPTVADDDVAAVASTSTNGDDDGGDKEEGGKSNDIDGEQTKKAAKADEPPENESRAGGEEDHNEHDNSSDPAGAQLLISPAESYELYEEEKEDNTARGALEATGGTGTSGGGGGGNPTSPRSPSSPRQQQQQPSSPRQQQQQPSSPRQQQQYSPRQQQQQQQLSPKVSPGGLSPLQGQQISPGASPGLSPSRHHHASRRGGGTSTGTASSQPPPRIPLMKTISASSAASTGEQHSDDHTSTQQQQQRPSLAPHREYSFRPRFESSDSFVRRDRTLSGSSIEVRDSDIGSPQQQHHAGPPPPAGGGGGGPPPRRPRLGTDDIIPPNLPPVHDFFGSYHDISPTTGAFRQGFFGSNAQSTPTSSQMAQGTISGASGSLTSPSAAYYADSADERSYGGASIVFTPSFGGDTPPKTESYPSQPHSGSGNRKRLGSRDSMVQQQQQQQQQHERMPSWGNNSAHSLVMTDSRGGLYRVPSPRVGTGDPYPPPVSWGHGHGHGSGGGGVNRPPSPQFGATPIGALPYHQRRRLMQKKREEEERFAYYQQQQQQQQQHHQQRQYPQYRQQQRPMANDYLPPREQQRNHSLTSIDSFDADSSPDRDGTDGGERAKGVERGSSSRGAPPRHPRMQKPNRQQSQPKGSSKPAHPGQYGPSNVHSDDGPSHGRTPSHIRAESSGSISSLGSAGPGSLHADQLRTLTDRLGKDITGFIKGKKQEPYKEQRRGQGFFAGVFGGDSPKNMTVEEYHQKNQAFLQKTAPEREMMAKRMRDLSPQPRAGIRETSPGPPNTRGVHRPRLPSIDADDWAEHDDNSGSRGSKGRKSKKKKEFQRHVDGGETRRGRDDDYLRSTVRAGNTDNARGRRHDMGAYGSTGFVPGSRRDSSSESDRNIAARGRSRNIETVSRRRMMENEESSYLSSDFSGDDESDESPSSFISASSDSDDESQDVNERTSLLPPSGISTHENERGDRTRSRHQQPRHSPSRTRRDNDRRERSSRQRDRHRHRDSDRYDDRDSRRGRRGRDSRERDLHHERRSRGRRRHQEERYYGDDYSDESDEYELSASSASSSQHRNWAKKKARILERERAKLIAQWKAEALAEEEAARKKREANRWYNRMGRWTSHQSRRLAMKTSAILTSTGSFISNMPLTINAVALAIVTLGVVWFKFAEENLDTCMPVHFHSQQCSFPEFPGCFYCDTSTVMYQVAVYFHYTCSTVAGILAMLFFAKVMLARRVVIDELSSPTTASPAGLICMTMVCVFAGRGMIGQVLVTLAAAMHLCLATWFIYMALAYHILPDPSWYPNTVGIGLSAVKAWLYYPMPGHFLMAISLTLNCFFFPISIMRVGLNKKISAPVGWIQMSAPAVALYALTIMAQPSFEEEHPDVTNFQKVHRIVYLPCMHVLFVLSVIGALSSVQSLWARWDSIRTKQFSPAHAAFCFPTLAHANAIQAYRGAIDAFSNIPPGSPIKITIYVYWVFVLLGGTITTFVITSKFFYHLPEWTQIDVSDEIEPPAPKETMMSEIVLTGETLRQKYVSPAVLQANEAGALVRLPDQYGRSRYVRTRKVTALGFEPIMTILELDEEREKLLDWVAKNPAKQRHRTLSVPGIDFNYGYGDFRGSGVFDGNVEEGRGSNYLRSSSRTRSQTHDAGSGSGSRRSNTLIY